MKRTAIMILAAFLFSLGSAPAAEGDKQDRPSLGKKDEKSKVADSLDGQLLDDLDSQLLEGLGDFPDNLGKVKKPQTDSTVDPNKKPLDQRGEGEDVGLGKSTDPLTRIGEKMKTAGDLIADRERSGKIQQLQKQILDELSSLITAAEKQRKAAGKNNSSKRRGSGKSDQQSNNPDSDMPPKDKSPSGKSTNRLGKTDKEGALAIIQGPGGLLKEFWGNLPKQVRLQMQSITAEQFLPKYEKLIQQYYKRLAEEGRNQP